MNYKAILFEGKTDEAFLFEFLKKKFKADLIERPEESRIPFDYNKIITSDSFNNFQLIMCRSKGKENIIDVGIQIIDSYMNDIFPNLKRLLIIRDINNSSKTDVFNSINDALHKQYTEKIFFQSSFGCEVDGFQIDIFPLGIEDCKHQCDEWGHCLEDYLLETIKVSNRQDIKIVYNEIVYKCIEKAIGLELKTSIKTPIYICMAFLQPKGNIEGFYRKIVGQNIKYLTKLFQKTSFEKVLQTFLS